MKLNSACLVILFLAATVGPAYCQGMESTSMQGAAAGLGGGLGAGAYKLYNSNSGAHAATTIKKSVQAQPTPATSAEIQAKTTLLRNSAKLKADAGDFPGAAKIWKELGEYRQKLLGTGDVGAGEAFQQAGMMHLKGKQYSQAEDSLKTALAFSSRINGANSPKSLPLLNQLADSLKQQDRDAEAITYYKQALAMEARSPGPDPKSAFSTKSSLGDAYFKTKSYTEAEPLLKQSIEIAEQNHYCDKASMTTLLANYAATLVQNNKLDESEQISKKIKALSDDGAVPKSP